MKQAIKRVVGFLFGFKLPCGHGRWRAKLGRHITCPVCGTGYTMVRFVPSKSCKRDYLLSWEA